MNSYKTIALALCLISGSATANTFYADVQLTQLQPAAQDTIWSRTKDVTPLYPVEMARHGIAGCAVFKLDIDEQGEAQQIELVTTVPAKGIAKHAKKVLKSWKWHNTTGKASVAEQKLIRLDFCMGGSSLDEAQERCKQQAKLQCSE